MKITYHGHACFTVETDGYNVVIDPYEGVRGFKDINLEANAVICSHGHHDHNFVDGVKISDAKSKFEISTISCFHDDSKGSKRGTNNINILTAEGKSVVHMGDLGHMLSDADIEKLQGCDVLMIPVGGFYTIGPSDAVQLIKQINPKLVIPMHYKDGVYGLEQIASIDEFLQIADEDIKSKLALVHGYGQNLEI